MPVGIEGNIASCCMCFTIKTGCKIIGMLSLFFSAMHFMIYTMMLIQVESNLPKCINMLEKGETEHKAVLNNCVHHSIWLVRAALLLGCLLYLFGLIGSSMLLKGISQRVPKLFYAWFLFCTVIIVRNLMSYGTFHDVNEGMKNLLFCLILLYFFCIVKYHERELNIGVDDLVLGTMGNTSMQEVVTTYPGDPNLPKDNPPPYSMVMDSPPPYSACAAYPPASQSTNQTPVPSVVVTTTEPLPISVDEVTAVTPDAADETQQSSPEEEIERAAAPEGELSTVTPVTRREQSAPSSRVSTDTAAEASTRDVES